MSLKKILLTLSFNLFVVQAFCQDGDKALLSTINHNLKIADEQYHYLMRTLPSHRFPQTFQRDTLKTSNSGWWCSGFYPGTLLYLYKATGDLTLKNEAEQKLIDLSKEQFNTSTHDLGFMMYCSFGNALKYDPKPIYKQILVQSAKSLATRFSPKVGVIKSWDSKPSDYLVIIDNMMNLELLFWATHETGDSSYYKIAVKHANTTLKNHFRKDYSSYHVLNYDPETGAVKQKKTAQGYSDESAWARGQAWGLYGYTVMYRETKNPIYLKQAEHIASFILAHPNLPEDKIPYWDFDAPNIPDAPRDVSAACVMASALIELSTYSDKNDTKSPLVDTKSSPNLNSKRYLATAKTIIKNLSSSKYLAKVGTNGGFILKHSVGNMPQHSEVDVPLSYADYYFVEAMLRYKNLLDKH